MKKLSERIKALRMKGETQSDFAQRLGTTQASISRYLNGRQPDRETLIRIAKRTGVSLDWLMTGNTPLPEKVTRAKGDDQVLQAALAYLTELDIPAREKNRTLDMIADAVKNKNIRKGLLNAWENSSKKK